MTSIPSTEPLWWARGNFVQITHINQISIKYWGEFLRIISTAFKPKHPLRPTNYQRAICCWWRQLHCQGGQCCWWDIFFLLRYFFFAGIFSFLAAIFFSLLRYFLFWWDIFFFWWDILLVYEMWVLQLFDITFTMVMEMVEGYFIKSPKIQIATKNASVKLLKLLQFSVLNRLSCWWWWWCYRNLYLSMFPGEKDCTLALNFGGGAETEDNVPARFEYIRLRALQVKFLVLPSCRVFEQPLLLQPDPNTLILEGHIHANPKPKVGPSTYSSSNSGRSLSRSPRLFFCRSRSRQFYQHFSSPRSHTAWSGDLAVQRWLCERVREKDVEAGADGGGEQVEGQPHHNGLCFWVWPWNLAKKTAE